jgi:hypothetical protein
MGLAIAIHPAAVRRESSHPHCGWSLMNQVPQILDPWELVWGQPYINGQTLATAIEQDLERDRQPDFRTRLLVRDAAVALRAFWGTHRFSQWVSASPVGRQIRQILREELGEPGFTAIRKRLVDTIDSPQVRQIFDLLGREIHSTVEVYIAGSIPTLIKGLTARPTSDIDFVNAVPVEIRRQRALLRKIEAEYGLRLNHMQAHYLPAHWESRRVWFGEFGGLRVYVVDEYDIFVSKLSSGKEKHQLDLRVLALRLDRDKAKRRLLTDGRAFLEDPNLKSRIEENWRFIFQETLFPEPPMNKADEGNRPSDHQTGMTPGQSKTKRSSRKKRG